MPHGHLNVMQHQNESSRAQDSSFRWWNSSTGHLEIRGTKSLPQFANLTVQLLNTKLDYDRMYHSFSICFVSFQIPSFQTSIFRFPSIAVQCAIFAGKHTKQRTVTNWLTMAMEASSNLSTQPLGIVCLLLCALCSPSLIHASSRTFHTALEAPTDARRQLGERFSSGNPRIGRPNTMNSTMLATAMAVSEQHREAGIQSRTSHDQVFGREDIDFADRTSSGRRLMNGNGPHNVGYVADWDHYILRAKFRSHHPKAYFCNSVLPLLHWY